MPVYVRMATEAGRAVVVKVADGPDGSGEGRRLAAEAQVVELAALPGVVEVVRSGPTGDGGFELVTALAGSRTLAGARLPLPEVAGVVGALAATVADLHDLGVVHGRLRAEHVVLHDDGRPVLCGFGGAGATGQVVAGCELHPADDVAALGALLVALLAPDAVVGDVAAGDWEPIPERRFGRGRRGWQGFAHRSLLNLADQAMADDRSVRPTARRFAEAVVAAVPGACLPGGDDAGVAGPHGRRGESLFDGVVAEAAPAERGTTVRRAASIAAGAVGLGLLVLGLGSVVGGPPVPGEVAGPVSIGLAGSAEGGGGIVVDEAAGVVEVDGTRYGVGLPGDRLLVDDWDCDGTTTVAVVRSSTGEVFVFDGWAAPGEPVSVSSLGRVDGAVAITPSPRCDGVEVTTSTGATTALTWGDR